MKSNVMQILKQLFLFLRLPCLVFLVSLLLAAGGYFGVHACDSLNGRFPLDGNPKDPGHFMGRFGLLQELCILLVFFAEFVCVVSFIWIVAATIYWPFRRKHLPEA